MNSKNKGPCYHLPREFVASSSTNPKNLCPLPDIYLVHGDQWATIARSFLQKTTVISIGCLKYDSAPFFDFSISKPKSSKTKLVLLVATSIGDEEDIIEAIDFNRLPENWTVQIAFHPSSPVATKSRLVHALQDIRNGNIEIVSGKTVDVISDASLVLCGYSVIAFEALILGVPAVRIYCHKTPPQFDVNDAIPTISGTDDIIKFMKKVEAGDIDSSRFYEVLKSYFGEIDGHAGHRMWYEISTCLNSRSI